MFLKTVGFLGHGTLAYFLEWLYICEPWQWRVQEWNSPDRSQLLRSAFPHDHSGVPHGEKCENGCFRTMESLWRKETRAVFQGREGASVITAREGGSARWYFQTVEPAKKGFKGQCGWVLVFQRLTWGIHCLVVDELSWEIYLGRENFEQGAGDGFTLVCVGFELSCDPLVGSASRSVAPEGKQHCVAYGVLVLRIGFWPTTACSTNLAHRLFLYSPQVRIFKYLKKNQKKKILWHVSVI